MIHELLNLNDLRCFIFRLGNVIQWIAFAPSGKEVFTLRPFRGYCCSLLYCTSENETSLWFPYAVSKSSVYISVNSLKVRSF